MLVLFALCDCYTSRETVCCVLWVVIWVSQKVVLSFLASLSDKKKNVFHLQVQKKRELLKWWSGQEFNFTVKMIVEWKYRMQLSVPHPAPRTPLHCFAIGNNKVNTSLDRSPSVTAVKKKHDHLQQSLTSYPLSLLIFQLFLTFCPSLAFIFWPQTNHV